MAILEVLIEKYAVERRKRLRPDQVAQYVDFRDPVLAGMDTDPYVDHDALSSKGSPLRDGSEVKVLISGGGMLSLMVAHRLVTEAGINSTDLVIVDKAGGFGGTWYWNRYRATVTCPCSRKLATGPGIDSELAKRQVEDVSLLLTNCHGHEIREHLERIAHTWNIQGQFATAVTGQSWDEEAKRWVVTLSRNLGPHHEPEHLTVRSQFLILAGGIQTAPHAPKLNGVQVFDSTPDKILMHTGRWDWSKSGGSQENPDMVKFKGKRVGIIGTGATAAQVVPHLAKWAKHLYVFQRTPSYVGPQVQKEVTDADWAQVANEPGWQYERIKNLDAMFTGKPDVMDKIQDGWSKVYGMRPTAGYSGKIITREMEEQHVKDMMNIDHPWAEEMRSHVDAVVKDTSTAEKLKAWYPGFCKRPTFHGVYLSIFNEPNVTLVDTDGRGVEAYTPNGVMANGSEYELDVLILATGYTVGLVDSYPSSALAAPLTGRDGRSLKSKWDGEDYGTFYGAMTNGFPNLFFASGNGGSVSQNAHSFYSLLSRLIANIVKGTLERAQNPERASVEVEKGAEDAWSAKIAERARWFAAFPACTPGYLTGEGLLQSQKDLTEEEEHAMAH